MGNQARRSILTTGATAGAMLIASAAAAETYQVGPGRTYTELDDVAGMLEPGDIVELDGDATYPGDVVLDAPGSDAQPIHIVGIRINGNRPVLSGGTNTLEVRADHYVIEGLEFTQGSFRCFYHHADDVTLRDSAIYDCPAHGLLGADGDSGSLLMEFCEVHHCGEGTQNHQIYMATDEDANPGSVFRMQHCYVHDGTGGNNVKSRAERNEIYCNWIEGAEYHELELIGPDDGIGTGGAREDSDVVGNVLMKTDDFSVVRFGGDGTGETEGRYRFVNNTVLTLPGGGAVFRLFDALESVEMHNNVFFALDGGSVNLVREVEANWTNGRQITGSHNWVGPDSQNVPPEWTATDTGTDPGFANLAGYDLVPESGSALVNGGSSDTIAAWDYAVPNPWQLPDCVPPMRRAVSAATNRVTDAAVDIGAYESGSTAGAGGVSGSAGSSGSSGASVSGGSSGASGASAASGAGGSSGTGASGGTSGSGGAGATSGAGGAGGSGGSSGSTSGGGASGSASGASGAAGAAPGGGSSGDSGSSSTSGGEAGEGLDRAGAAGAQASNSSDDDGGCGCRAAGTQSGSASASLLLLGLVAMRRRRRS